MKRTLILIGAVILTGCTVTHVRTDKWELRRNSFLQRQEIPFVQIATNGTATLQGYKTDGGNEALGAITAAAVSAAVQSIKP